MRTVRRPSPAARLILASASPRRISLLREAGYAFEAVPPPIPEPQDRAAGLPPAAFAEALSYFKAAAVAERHDRAVVLAGDTVVALGDRLYGKPVDRDEAREMLLALTACPHRVITGVTLLCAATGTRRIEHDVTIVHMRPMRGAELEAYLDSGAWRGKAGAYGIQDRADAFVQRIEGSFTNVVGFPMERITSMLNDWGIRPAGGAAREPEPQRDRP